MIVSFLMPLPIRGVPAALLWIFYRQLATLPRDEVAFLGSADYFVSTETHRANDRWELLPHIQTHYGYTLPTDAELGALQTRTFSDDLFEPLLQQVDSLNHAWAWLLTRDYPPLAEAITRHLRELGETQRIEAVTTWGNCVSLSRAAASLGIPVIHHELGALRPPDYRMTAYLDFSGVNGNTEAAKRFQRFSEQDTVRQIPPMPPERLVELLAVPGLVRSSLPETPEFDVGLALQVENDSNVLAFANGFNNLELIWTAQQYFPKNNITVRVHPSGYLPYDRLLQQGGTIDHSANAMTFLHRCERIATVNSSVALEAMLYGRPTCILGDSPFRFFAIHSMRELRTATRATHTTSPDALTFAVLGYHIPSAKLFDADYYRWRLTNPTEAEIILAHAEHYESLPR